MHTRISTYFYSINAIHPNVCNFYAYRIAEGALDRGAAIFAEMKNITNFVPF